MPPALPPTSTLRLKYHKTVVILDAKPGDSFDIVLPELLRALQETRQDGKVQTATGPVEIPSEISDIQLAKPNDIHDHAKGWTRLRVSADEDEWDASEELAGEGKIGQKRKRGKEARMSLKDAGLKDGSVLAFRFRTPKVVADEGFAMDEAEETWDVVIPSYEDSAGVVNEGDVGAVSNYDG